MRSSDNHDKPGILAHHSGHYAPPVLLRRCKPIRLEYISESDNIYVIHHRAEVSPLPIFAQHLVRCFALDCKTNLGLIRIQERHHLDDNRRKVYCTGFVGTKPDSSLKSNTIVSHSRADRYQSFCRLVDFSHNAILVGFHERTSKTEFGTWTGIFFPF